MAESYDAYHKWLGIPPKDQPPHHYRLLGLSPFEEDEAVIENAAQSRMRHVKTFASGPRGKLSQKMLNELSTAQSCLLDADKKAAYDEQLKSTLEPEVVASPPMLPALPADQGLGELESLESLTPVVNKVVPYRRTSYRVRPRRSNAVLMLVLLGTVAFGLLLAVGVVVVLFAILRKPASDDSPISNSRPDIVRRERPTGTPPNQPSGRNPRFSETTDLLALVDLDAHVVSGKITRGRDGSLNTNSSFCRLAIPYSPRSSYEIIAKVTRVSGSDSVILGLSYKGRRFAVVVDGFPEYGYRTGLNLVNGHTLVQNRNNTSKQGRRLRNGRETEIRCQVHIDRVEVYIDNQLVTSYSGSPARLSLRSSMNMSGQPDLFLATWHTPFRISELKVRELDPLESMRSGRGR